MAQALAQFELYNHVDWDLPEDSEIDDRSNRMLLVLLDEMNLARTEYYFSEFLSKLETRRMVKEANPDDRVRAEIELDMGRLLNGRNSIRLYPGQNVLFTGTMNEDESTQALSDKVIDRASVLRLWRPKKTSLDHKQPPQNPPSEGLRFENWQKWRRKLDDLDQFQAEIDRWIDQTNHALTKMARPFAFRVDRAIRSYVATGASSGSVSSYWLISVWSTAASRLLTCRRNGIRPDKTHSRIRLPNGSHAVYVSDGARGGVNFQPLAQPFPLVNWLRLRSEEQRPRQPAHHGEHQRSHQNAAPLAHARSPSA